MKKFHVSEPWFTHIRNQAVSGKTHEGRPALSRLANETIVGEVVEFWTGPDNKDYDTKTDSYRVRIGEKTYFFGIQPMVDCPGIGIMLPGMDRSAWYGYYSKLRQASGHGEDGMTAAIQVTVVKE